MRRGLPVLVLVFLCAAAADAAAQAAAAPSSEDCLACHDDPSAARANGGSVAVAGKGFGESIHGGLSCVDCHQDLAAQAEWPHLEKLARVNCAACHETSVAKYDAGAHA